MVAADGWALVRFSLPQGTTNDHGSALSLLLGTWEPDPFQKSFTIVDSIPTS